MVGRLRLRLVKTPSTPDFTGSYISHSKVVVGVEWFLLIYLNTSFCLRELTDFVEL